MIVKEVTLAVIIAVNMQELSFWRTEVREVTLVWCSLLIEFEFVTLYSTTVIQITLLLELGHLRELLEEQSELSRFLISSLSCVCVVFSGRSLSPFFFHYSNTANYYHDNHHISLAVK